MLSLLKNPFLAFSACVGLSACGGGGGGSGSGSDGSRTTNWSVTSEYNNNYGINLINAEALYADGATGFGMTVAIIDTGIDFSHSEFRGRISEDSYNIVNNQSLSGDTDGHGTLVAGVIAADFGSGNVQGVAFDAEILAIDAYDDSVEGFYNDDTADAIRYAVDNGADVINMSLGGGGSSSLITSALEYAADNGVVVVIATGNDGSLISDPAYEAGGSEYSGHIVAVGSVDSSGTISDFSNACNSRDSRYCLVAPGENIYTTTVGGGYGTVDGTSFSAPHVAGAVALLMDAFPNLSGAQAVQIILESAYDIGQSSPDFDQTSFWYGNGLLDLEAAMGPAGSLSTVAGDVATDISNAGLQLSSAFGDSLTSEAAFANMVLYDLYDRAYRTDITDRIETNSDTFNVTGFSDFDSLVESTTSEIGSTTASFTLDTVEDEFDGTMNKELLEISLVSKVGKDMKLGFSSGGTNTKNINFNFVSNAQKTYALTDAAITPYGFMTSDGQGVSLTRNAKGWNMSYGLRTATQDDASSYAADFKADKKFTNGTYMGLRGSIIFEDGSFLGTTGTGSFNGGYDASTSAITLAVGHQFQDLTLFGQLSVGATKVNAQSGALLSDFGTITSHAAMLGVTYDNLRKKGDSLSLIVSRPLRVSSGDAQLNATIAGDSSADATSTDTRVGLTPTGSQINFELGYRSLSRNGAVWGFGLAYVIEPNHDASADAEIAAGVTYSRAF